MNTATYIKELLYRYECVIVPGFGAFLTKRQPATLNQSIDTFFPPQKIISFNAQLQNNDGLLANYIAVAENISYTDAVAKIQHYVVFLNQEMKSGKRVELEDVGSFFIATENTLQFEPSYEVNYLTEAFGLNSFVSPAVTREVVRETLKEEVEVLEENVPALVLTPEKRKDYSYLKYAAILVLALGVFGFMGIKSHNNLNQEHNFTAREEVKQEVLQEATFALDTPAPIILNITEEEKEVITTSSVSENSGKYHIVAGAFRIKKNAIKKLDRLKSRGFNARLIGTNKYGLHQVVYNSYSNRVEALQALKTIKKGQDKRAWLLIQNL